MFTGKKGGTKMNRGDDRSWRNPFVYEPGTFEVVVVGEDGEDKQKVTGINLDHTFCLADVQIEGQRNGKKDVMGMSVLVHIQTGLMLIPYGWTETQKAIESSVAFIDSLISREYTAYRDATSADSIVDHCSAPCHKAELKRLAATCDVDLTVD